jgi:hypothetical protein
MSQGDFSARNLSLCKVKCPQWVPKRLCDLAGTGRNGVIQVELPESWAGAEPLWR